MEDVSSFVRIPIAGDAVEIPIIAAGGVGDARGLVAALALGAEGVLVGTRFMASKESPVHQNIKEWLLQLGETDTMMIQRSIKNATRVIRTEHSQKILDMEEKGATLEELLPLISGERGRAAYESGDASEATVTCGQVVGLINEIPSVKEIIDDMVSGARQTAQRLRKIGIDS